MFIYYHVCLYLFTYSPADEVIARLKALLWCRICVSPPQPPAREGEPRPDEVTTTAVQALLYGQGESKPNNIDALIPCPLGYHVNGELREKKKKYDSWI